MSQPIVFLGPPASGKGTQARRLAELREFAYLSTGGLLRRELKEGSYLGQQAQPYLDRGEYVPDEIMVPMVLAWVSGKQGQWILDGFPRTLAQAEALDEALSSAGKTLPRAIALEVPDEELRRRVSSRLECESCHWVSSENQAEPCPKCGGSLVPRADDDQKRFHRRLEEFKRLVVPTIDYYRDQSRLKVVNGVGSPEEVYARLET